VTRRAVASMLDGARTPEAIGAFLEQLAEETGNLVFRQAARALHHQAPGRPQSSDRAALIRRTEKLIASGKPRSARHAYTIVAESVTDDPRQQRNITERLRRYFAAKHRTT
jgi:DNA-binding FadR family transcriptional regulator